MGTALNQDGRSSSLSAPYGPAQNKLVMHAWSVPHFHIVDADAELHGTGTALGDPIEVAACVPVYSRSGEGALGMCSLKSRGGHGESAAGLMRINRHPGYPGWMYRCAWGCCVACSSVKGTT